ncbi:MAG: hypothetical protein RL076_855 [Chloroflexota bacterium]
MFRIAIIGMGLIGTSLGQAIRAADNKTAPMGAVEVVGYDTNTAHLKEARARLAIDKMVSSIADAVKDAHLVVVAVPAQLIPHVFTQMAPHLQTGVVVTDVTSTKEVIAKWAAELLPASTFFVGGHPMAGRETSGPSSAKVDLFKGAMYCLCPTANTPGEAIAVCEALVERVGAKAYFMDVVEHDAYVAGISHLPFVTAAMLVEITSSVSSWREMSALAAGGFRDSTRLASGDVTMHRDIVMTNRSALVRWLDAAIERLIEIRDAVQQGDEATVTTFFQRAKTVRDEWIQQKPGMRPGEADFEDTGVQHVQRPSLFGQRIGDRK